MRSCKAVLFSLFSQNELVFVFHNNVPLPLKRFTQVTTIPIAEQKSVETTAKLASLQSPLFDVDSFLILRLGDNFLNNLAITLIAGNFPL